MYYSLQPLPANIIYSLNYDNGKRTKFAVPGVIRTDTALTYSVLTNADLVRHIGRFLYYRDQAVIRSTSRLFDDDAIAPTLRYSAELQHCTQSIKPMDILHTNPIIYTNTPESYVTHLLQTVPPNQLLIMISGLCNIIDMTVFAHLHNVELWNCPWITDVVSLHRVHTLQFYNCQELQDIP
jgi:hypothetical protein